MNEHKLVLENGYKNGNRVELHSCIKNSEWYGPFGDVDVVRKAYELGQTAIAIVDRCSVRNFSAAARTQERIKWNNRDSGRSIKVIWGVEVEFYSNKDAGYAHIVDRNDNYTTFSAVLLAKNRIGLKNINRIMSYYLIAQGNNGMITRSAIEWLREGILVGASADSGELSIGVASGKSRRQLKRIASFYDYLEISQRSAEPEFKGGDQTLRKKSPEDINKRIMKTGDMATIPTVAVASYSIGCGDYYNTVKTTDEMLNEFSYLGDRALEVVVTNPNMIADQIEETEPIPKGRFYPAVEGAEEKIRELCYEKAKEIYGNNLPQAVSRRLERELEVIIGNGEAGIYYLNREIVDRAIKDGNPVSYRGMIGGSLVAFLIGLTQVNPLPPHYVCPVCKNEYETNDAEAWTVGIDLPGRLCPNCNTLMNQYGFNIPGETLFGIQGDRSPDIDIVVPTDYGYKEKPVVRKLLRGCLPIRAGKVIAGNNAPSDGSNRIITVADEYGLFVVPLLMDIEDFTPFQFGYIADGERTLITHQDSRCLDCLLKIDVIGDKSLQLLKKLAKKTGVDLDDIPLNNNDVISTFSSHQSLGINYDKYILNGGAYGIPDFDNDTFRDVADCINPKNVSELIKCYGLTWGTNTWNERMRSLVLNEEANIRVIISSREDIFITLCSKGLSVDEAYRIMDTSRKNRALSVSQITEMRKCNVPKWWIDSLQNGKFFSIRALDVARTITGIRLAWFKVNYAKEYYSIWLSNDDFYNVHRAELKEMNIEDVEHKIINNGKEKGNKKEDDGELKVYQVLYEMYARGIALMD